MTLTSACTTTPTQGIAIKVLCSKWKGSLPTRSHDDTVQTQREIGQAYATYEAACKDKFQ